MDGLSLSLNMWFDFEPRLQSPPLPLTEGLLVELSRHVEAWLGVLLHPTDIPGFLRHCATELAAPFDRGTCAAADEANENPLSLSRQWLVARNLLFAELATSWVGWSGLRPFFDTLLHPDRFHRLQAVEPEMAGRTSA